MQISTVTDSGPNTAKGERRAGWMLRGHWNAKPLMGKNSERLILQQGANLCAAIVPSLKYLPLQSDLA